MCCSPTASFYKDKVFNAVSPDVPKGRVSKELSLSPSICCDAILHHLTSDLGEIKMMLFRRVAAAARPGFGASFSTRASFGPLSLVSQVASNTGENRTRSFKYLFNDRSLLDASAEKSKVPGGMAKFGAIPKKAEPTRAETPKAMFDFFSVEELADKNKEVSMKFLGNEKALSEDANLRKVVNTLLEEFRPDEDKLMMGSRNGRAPKKANHGRRPCSHVARRSKRMKRHRGW